MSENSKECLVHYDSRHLQVRHDFYGLCGYDKEQYNKKLNRKGKPVKDEPNQECMAKVLRLLETLTNDRKAQWQMDAINLKNQGLTPPPEPKEYPITLSYDAICQLLYNTYGESIVRNSVAVLIEWKYIRRFQATINSIPVYWLEIEYMQSLLKRQAEQAISGCEINTQRKRGLKSTPKTLKSTPEGSESNSLAFEINTNNIKGNNTDKKDSDKDTYNENVANANSHAPTPSLEDQLEAARQLLQAHGQYPQSQEKQPELSTPIVETPVPNVENVHPTRQDDDQTEQASEQSYSRTTTQNSPDASVTDALPSGQKPARPPRQQKPKVEKPSLSVEEKNLQKEVQEWINSMRGYKLYGRAPKEQIFAERNATHALAHMLYLHTQDENCDECCTWDDLDYTYTYCHDIDKYWSRPENKVRIGSYAVLQQFAPAMALKVQQPIDLDKARKDVHKHTALEHGSRPARAPMTAEEIRKTSVWEGVK